MLPASPARDLAIHSLALCQSLLLLVRYFHGSRACKQIAFGKALPQSFKKKSSSQIYENPHEVASKSLTEDRVSAISVDGFNTDANPFISIGKIEFAIARFR